MRRLLALIFTFTAVFLLCSCDKELQSTGTTDSTVSAQSGTAGSTTPAIESVITQKPMYAISLPPVKESSKNEDGHIYFNYTYQNISLVLPEPEVADKIILDFLNRTDDAAKSAETMLKSAKEAYAIEGHTWVLQTLYEPARFDPGILSLFGQKLSYTGGAHALNSGQAATYDLLTGNALLLTDIIRDSVTADTISQLVNDVLAEKKEQLFLHTNYAETVTQLFSNGLAEHTQWYLSNDGLCFYFDIYEIAPYSSGCIVAEIPYSQLTGILEDAYFPTEDDVVNGTVTAEIFAEETLEGFTQFAEIVLDEASKKLLIYTDSSVSDIRLTVGDVYYSAFSNTPGQSITTFAAYTLTPGDAIMAEFDPNITALLLSYKSGSESISYTITIDENSVHLAKN